MPSCFYAALNPVFMLAIEVVEENVLQCVS